MTKSSVVCTTLTAFIVVASFARVYAQTGSIAGTVTEGIAGIPVSGAKVTIVKLTEFQTDKGGHIVIKTGGNHSTVIAGIDGKYQLNGLPPGRYEVCAFGIAPLQLTGCGWIPTAVISLSAGQSITGLNRNVLDGRAISIKVSDLDQKISLPDLKGRAPRWENRFNVGVVDANGNYAPATLSQAAPSAYTFTVVVPKQRDVGLFIDSDLTVRDDSGVQLQSRLPSAKRVPATGPGNTAVDLNVR